LFLTFARHWLPSSNEPGRYVDEQIYPVLSALRSRGWRSFIGVDCPYTQDLDKVADVFASRVKQSDPDISWRGFYSVPVSKAKVFRSRSYFSASFRRFRESRDVLPRLCYRDIDLSETLAPIFHYAFVRMLPENVRMRLAARTMLAIEKPEALLLTYETGPYQRAYVVEAQRLGIPIVGLMHGVISPNSSHYMHSGVSNTQKNPPSGFSVPDVTCVWGKAFKDVLVKTGCYPDTSIAVTGNWQYDAILSYPPDMRLTKAGQFSGNNGDPISVLICSSRQESAKFVRSSLLSLSDFGDCKIRIKPHPLESRKDISKVLGEFNSSKVELVGGTLREALANADIVITQPSTVVFEALLMGKTLVMLNMSQSEGFENVMESGACICINNPDELSEALSVLKDDPSSYLRLETARREFVQNFFYRLDGKAAVRVADVIMNLLSPCKAAFVN
jgi:glycosyltransferase involved in cell wall biosynthesis